MQIVRMILIALAAGIVAAGLVWFSIDLAGKLREILAERLEKRKRDIEAKALIEQAEEPENEERPI